MTGIIPIEYLWYIIGAVSVPVFILIYLKALKRNRADKTRVSMRRKRFERMMKSRTENKAVKHTSSGRSTDRTGRAIEIPSTDRIKINRVDNEDDRDLHAIVKLDRKSLNRAKSDDPTSQSETERITQVRAADRKSGKTHVEVPADEHWLRGVKLPAKREKSEHWLETFKPKRSRHWLENLRKINRVNNEGSTERTDQTSD